MPVDFILMSDTVFGTVHITREDIELAKKNHPQRNPICLAALRVFPNCLSVRWSHSYDIQSGNICSLDFSFYGGSISVSMSKEMVEKIRIFFDKKEMEPFFFYTEIIVWEENEIRET